MTSSHSYVTSLRCGLAGWHYPQWDRIVYPSPRPRNFHPIEYLAQYFDVLEINTSFYQILRPEVTRLWTQKLIGNPNFRFTAKLHQRFTHDRVLAADEIRAFREGLRPLVDAGRLGCVVMQFPWSFRFTAENRDYFIQLRRAFHSLPLVAEMRHASWASEEALGTFIDYHVGFVNIDQPEYVNAMPPTAHLTWAIGYVRLHGRNGTAPLGEQRSNYLYNEQQLSDWCQRIEKIRRFAKETYVIANNEAGGKSVVNALQLQNMLLGRRHVAPAGLHDRFPSSLRDHAQRPRQQRLFECAPSEPQRAA